MTGLLKTYKKDVNQFYQNRKKFLENQDKAKQFSVRVKEHHQPLRAGTEEGDEEEEGGGYEGGYADSAGKRKPLGNQLELEKIKQKIRENQQNNLTSKLFKEGKKAGGSIKIQRKKNLESMTARNLENSRSIQTTQSVDYLKIARKRIKDNISHAQLVQNKKKQGYDNEGIYSLVSLYLLIHFH